MSDEQKLYLCVERVLTKTNTVELQKILWACKPGNEIDYDRISKISDNKKVQKINELIQVYLLSAFRNLDELVNNIERAGIDIKSQIYREMRG